MGWRFRKTIRIGKGLRINFGKTGVSLSGGIPGSGLYFTTPQAKYVGAKPGLGNPVGSGGGSGSAGGSALIGCLMLLFGVPVFIVCCSFVWRMAFSPAQTPMTVRGALPVPPPAIEMFEATTTDRPVGIEDRPVALEPETTAPIRVHPLSIEPHTEKATASIDESVTSPISDELKEKRAKSRLEMAKALHRKSRDAASRKHLQEVIDDFPDTTAAKEAAKLLNR